MNKPIFALRKRRASQGRGDGESTLKASVVAAATAILPALLVIVALRVLAVGLYRVPTESMEPSIRVGDCIVGEKLSYRVRCPRAGEVVTFESPEEPHITLVKRVVAVGGQTVDVADGTLYVDGQPVWEPYACDRSCVGEDSEVTYPHIVREGCVWVMGDNRENSRDSRWFGDVPASCVSSRVVLTYWPPERVGPMR